MGGSTVSTGSTWTFTPTEADDGAEITCRAGNTYTDRPGYNRLVSNVHRLSVYYEPKLTMKGNLNLNEGQDLTLTCSSDQSNTVTTWSYPGGGIAQGPTLTRTNLSRHDDRDYTCTGRFNNVCTNLQSSKVVHVTVNYAPDVTTFKEVAIDESQPLTLTSEAEGRPSDYTFKPFVQFWGDQKVDTQTGVRRGGVYNWTTGAATYLDTGEYECSVNNGMPDIRGQVEQKKKTQIMIRGKPVSTSDSGNIARGEIGSRVYLHQTFYTSRPKVTRFDWRYNNSPVIGIPTKNNTKVTLEKGGVTSMFDGVNVSLVIKHFQQEGVYTVKVCTRLGCGSASVNLTGAAKKGDDGSPDSRVATIAGAVVGAVTLVAIVVVAVVVFTHRRRNENGNRQAEGNAETTYDSLDGRDNNPNYTNLQVSSNHRSADVDNANYAGFGPRPAVEYEQLNLHHYENTKTKDAVTMSYENVRMEAIGGHEQPDVCHYENKNSKDSPYVNQ